MDGPDPCVDASRAAISECDVVVRTHVKEVVKTCVNFRLEIWTSSIEAFGEFRPIDSERMTTTNTTRGKHSLHFDD